MIKWKNQNPAIREIAHGRARKGVVCLPESREKTTTKQKLLGFLILAAITAAFLALTACLGGPLLALASNPDEMRAFVESWGVWGRLAFLGVQVLQGFLPIPLELTTVAGGYIFGPVEGALLTVASTVISTTLIFYVTKLCGHKLINLFFTPERQKKMRYFRDPKLRNLLCWVFFLIPGTPKRLFVFTAGLVPQAFGRFLLVSTVARIPTILACTFGGHALGQEEYETAVVLLLAELLLGGAGFLAYRRFTRRKKEKNGPEN